MSEAKNLFSVLRQSADPDTVDALEKLVEEAPDRYPLPDQVGDIAIDGSLGGLEFGGKYLGGYRPGCAPQDLNNLKKPVGSSHDPIII